MQPPPQQPRRIQTFDRSLLHRASNVTRDHRNPGPVPQQLQRTRNEVTPHLPANDLHISRTPRNRASCTVVAGVFGVFVGNGRFVVVDVVGVQTARALLVAVGAEVVAEEHGWVVGGFADLAFVVEVDSEFRHEFREM